jgi:hypothetical protein
LPAQVGGPHHQDAHQPGAHHHRVCAHQQHVEHDAGRHRPEGAPGAQQAREDRGHQAGDDGDVEAGDDDDVAHPGAVELVVQRGVNAALHPQQNAGQQAGLWLWQQAGDQRLRLGAHAVQRSPEG